MVVETLAGLEGAIVHIDDVLMYGKTQEEHDTRLHTVLKKIESAGGTLNKDKINVNLARSRLPFRAKW